MFTVKYYVVNHYVNLFKPYCRARPLRLFKEGCSVTEWFTLFLPFICSIVNIYLSCIIFSRATSWQRHIILYHTITVFLISRHWSPGNSQIEILVPQRAFALSDILSPPSNTYVDLAPDYFKLYNLSAFTIQIITFLRSSVYLPGTSPFPVNTDDLSLWII